MLVNWCLEVFPSKVQSSVPYATSLIAGNDEYVSKIYTTILLLDPAYQWLQRKGKVNF